MNKLSLALLAFLMVGNFASATATLTTAPPAHLESEVEAIMALSVSNANGINDAQIDSKINSLTRDEQFALIEPLHRKLSSMQSQLAQLDTDLGKTNEPTLETLRGARAMGETMAIGAAGVSALEESLYVFSLMRQVKIELALQNLDLPTDHLRPELRSRLKAATVVRNGRLVPSFTKVLKLSLNDVFQASLIEDSMGARIGGLTVTAAAATAFALTAQAGIALLPEKIGDRELLDGRNSVKASIEHLRDVVDSLSTHLELIESKYKTK